MVENDTAFFGKSVNLSGKVFYVIPVLGIVLLVHVVVSAVGKIASMVYAVFSGQVCVVGEICRRIYAVISTCPRFWVLGDFNGSHQRQVDQFRQR